MITDASVKTQLEIYICPACGHALQQQGDMLSCPACSQTYPISEGVPDFIREELARSSDPVFRRMVFLLLDQRNLVSEFLSSCRDGTVIHSPRPAGTVSSETTSVR